MLKNISATLALALAGAACGPDDSSPAPETSDSALASSPPPATWQGETRVLGVYDGDTITVVYQGREERIRLKGINAPELHPRQSYAIEARDFVSEEIPRTITLRFDKTCEPNPQPRCRDKYHRLLAYVFVGEEDIGAELLKRGLARLFVYRGQPFDRKNQYQDIQREAKANHVGIWSY